MKNSVVTTARGAVYEAELSGAVTAVELRGVTMAIGDYPCAECGDFISICIIAPLAGEQWLSFRFDYK
jgi:hypothetical protein